MGAQWMERGINFKELRQDCEHLQMHVVCTCNDRVNEEFITSNHTGVRVTYL
jgi:hypothetical protein